MDAANILVGVLTSAAVGWLIWVEIHSRRNAALQSAQESQERTESKSKEERPISAATSQTQKTLKAPRSYK
jgi:hypothetical protein